MSVSTTPQTGHLSNPTPYQLRSLVLDYLAHHSYTNTAKAFLRDSAVKQFNADGDEIELPLSTVIDTALRNEVFEEDLKKADWREEIKTCISSGRIRDAIDLLNDHFPRVLSPDIEIPLSGAGLIQQTGHDAGSCRSDVRFQTMRKDYVAPHSLDPEHLSLNLRIQAFIEACRTVPLIYEPARKRRSTGLSDADVPADQQRHQSLLAPERRPSNDEEKQMTLLSKAQKLYALVNMLPNPSDREQYHDELKNVAGLLAYVVPEKSLMSKYLSQERRDAVAEQICSAILHSSNNPVISTLELLVRHVTVSWALANEHCVTHQPGAVVPPTSPAAKKVSKDPEIVPAFELGVFLNAKPALVT